MVQSTQVAPGIHRVEHAAVNCYVIEDGDRLALVDAGLPSTWPVVLQVIEELGRRPDDVAVIAVTHAHFDHLGFAARARREIGAPVWVHEDDAYLAAHPYRYKPERNRFVYPLRYPRSIPLLLRMAAAGALNVRGVTDAVRYAADPTQPLDMPGRPFLVHTPGHTDGHCALHFPDRDALISGEALVTLDPYTAATGPQIVSAAATANTRQALASLDALDATGASVVLPGHGEPWTDGVGSAVAAAKARGPS